MEDTPKKDTLPELYPQCVSLRKELDSLLRTISSPSTLQAPVHPGGRSYAGPLGREFALKGAETQVGGWDGRVNGGCSVAKLQRFSALTRQFCMLVLSLQDALSLAKSSGLSRNMYSIWERRVQDMVADAESFRREAEGRMNLEQQRVQEAMRDRKALLGDADLSKRWGDMHNAELMYAKERDRLHESRTLLDSVLSQGWSVVGQLVSQNASLKKARRKVLDMASSAGVASTLLGAVSRRQHGDKWLVYGGMILTLVFFFVVYRLVHHGSIFGFSNVVEAEDEAAFTELTRPD